MNEVLEKIQKIGIVPVVVLNDAKDAAPLAKALCDGGLPCAEVTFRTEAAEESIRIMAEQFPQMLVGAGTVLTTEQVDRAVAAGAKFIVSPPAASAGKNFTTSNPSSIACSTSLGFAVPGVTGTPFSIQYFTTFGFNPGLTMNLIRLQS